MAKSMYDEKARERYERRKEGAAEKSKHRWLASIGALSVISFVTSVFTGYTTWLQRTDDIRVMLGEAGTILYNDESKRGVLFAGDIALINLGNHNALITSVRIGYLTDFSSLPEYCKFANSNTATTFVPVVLKPGDVSYSSLKIKVGQTSVDSINIPTKDSDGRSPRKIGGCVMVGYTTYESSSEKSLLVTQLELDHYDNQGANGDDEAGLGPASTEYLRAKKQGRVPRTILKRNRSTISWVNQAIDSILFKACVAKWRMERYFGSERSVDELAKCWDFKGEYG